MRLVYNDSSSSFSHHHQNIQKFAIEIYKVKHHDEQSRTKNLEFPLEIKNSEKKNLLEKKINGSKTDAHVGSANLLS